MCIPKCEQMRIRSSIYPGNNRLATLCLAVKGLKPSQWIALVNVFGGKLACARSIGHAFILTRGFRAAKTNGPSIFIEGSEGMPWTLKKTSRQRRRGGPNHHF